MRLRTVLVGITTAVALALAPTIGSTASAAPLPVTFNFFAGIPNEFAQHGGSLPGSNDFTCHPTAAHPDPVVLVHGTGGSQQTNWGAYVPLLKNAGYCVYALTYGAPAGLGWPFTAIGGMEPMEPSARQLARFVDKVLATTHATKVDIVGHSQGTLIPDYYAKFLGGKDKIHRDVSLAPLWNGTGTGGADVAFPLARRLGLTEMQMPFCHACAQLDHASPFMTKLRSHGGPYLPTIDYTNISTRYDEAVVPYTSGQLPGGRNVRNIVVQNGCPVDYTEHAGLAGSRRAAYFVLNALDPDHPRPVPCDRAAPFSGSAF